MGDVYLIAVVRWLIFSILASSSFDGSTSFTSTSTLNLVSNSTSFTSTASGTSSSLGILVTSSSTTSLEPTSTTKASTSATDPSTSGENASGAVVGAGGIGTATGSGGPSSPTAGNGSSNSDSTAPPTQTVVGGVVGGVAGLAILVVLMLFLLRWHRRRQRTIQASAGDDSEVAPPGTAQSGAMTQRSSNVPLAAAAIAPGFFKRLRPHSGMTTATTETAPSERGFQNLGGRKLPSVLAAGGDGYGGGYDKETLSGSSFYRDSQGLHGGPGSPSASGFAGPSAGPLDHGARKVVDAGDKEVAIMRPSPARTPVTSQGAFEVLPSPTRGPTIPRATPTPPPPIGIITRDAIGRSRPSFNGSRGSRFTEETA